MGSRTETLSLEMRAKYLAQGAIDSMKLGLDGVSDKARSVGKALGEMGGSLKAGLGNLTENLLTGQDFGTAALNLGAFMAGELVQEFSGTLAQKLAGTTIIGAIGAQLTALGAAMGGIIDTAMGIAMAALPFVLIAALVAAVVVLATNEDIRNKVIDFAKGIGQWIVDNIGPFIGKVVDFFLGIPGKLVDLGASIVKAIVDGLISLPGKVADVVRQAFSDLKIDIGPFHIRSTGVTIDLPEIDVSSQGSVVEKVRHHAAGGWVGLHGPEVGLLGEQGPEYVVPNDQLGGLGGGTVHLILNLAGQTVADVLLPLVSRELAYELMRSAPTGAKV